MRSVREATEEEIGKGTAGTGFFRFEPMAPGNDRLRVAAGRPLRLRDAGPARARPRPVPPARWLSGSGQSRSISRAIRLFSR